MIDTNVVASPVADVLDDECTTMFEWLRAIAREDVADVGADLVVRIEARIAREGEVTLKVQRLA